MSDAKRKKRLGQTSLALYFVFAIVFPFIPMIAEGVVNMVKDMSQHPQAPLTPHIELACEYITLAIFTVALGSASENALLFGLSIVIGFVQGVLYGASKCIDFSNNWMAWWFPALGTFCIFVWHMTERWRRHIGETECYPDWLRMLFAEPQEEGP